MRRRINGGKIIKIVLCVVLFATLFTFIVMSLWNAILPAVLGVKAITFWQALGIIILSKILFGGFGGGGGGPWKGRARARWRENLAKKWDNMSPEEREKFKSSLQERCGNWRRPFGGRRFNEDQPEEKGQAGAE
ncbi:MAG: hypothetical protein J7578_15025 [Chitinophagaceae bacterium]|nr:hypothetical protein [Chitinophagaceae bacterium]